MDRQHIREEDTFLWLLRGDLKEKLKVKIRQYKPNAMRQNCFKQKEIANADSVNNLMIQ
jgi:hypothetical protein